MKLLAFLFLLTLSAQALAVHNCSVTVSSIGVADDYDPEPTNYFSPNVVVPNQEVSDSAMLVDLINDKDPKLTLGKATLWLGKTIDEGDGSDIIDATAKLKIKGNEVEMNLILSADATFGTAMSKLTLKIGSRTEYYHCNLSCRK